MCQDSLGRTPFFRFRVFLGPPLGLVEDDAVLGALVLAQTGLLLEDHPAAIDVAGVGVEHGVRVYVLLQVLLLGEVAPAYPAVESLYPHVDGHEVPLQ